MQTAVAANSATAYGNADLRATATTACIKGRGSSDGAGNTGAAGTTLRTSSARASGRCSYATCATTACTGIRGKGH